VAKFRQARPEDIPQIVSFTKNTWSWGDYLPRVIGGWVERGEAYVLEEGGEVLAVAGMRLVGESAYLQGLRVRPEHRGRGVGTEMTILMAEEAKRRGARVATLLVAEWNTPSLKAVAKAGFAEVGSIYGGVPDRAQPARCLEGGEAEEAVEAALREAGGVACLPDDPWVCTYLSAEDLLARGRPCLGATGLYVGRFSFGGGAVDAEGDVTALRGEGFKRLHGRYILFARRL
jgi:ribosomal protein S18 acetylase RimI-like enzyme